MNANHERIRHIFEQIETPAYDVTNDVLNKLHARRKRAALKPVIILAAVLCLSVVLLGAARLIGWQTFDIFGNARPSDDPHMPAETPQPVRDSDPTPGPFDLMEVEAGEVKLVSHRDGSGSGQTGYIRSGDFTVLDSLIKDSTRPLEMPGYIPAGYTFAEGNVQFYLTEDSLDAEMIYSESRDGETCEIYRLPDGYSENIEYVYLKYTDDAGNVIIYDAMLSSAVGPDSSVGFGAPESAGAEKIEVPGYDAATIVIDEARANWFFCYGYLYKEIPPIDTVWVFSVSPAEREEREALCGEAVSHEIYGAVVCSIHANDLSKEEAVRMMESIR